MNRAPPNHSLLPQLRKSLKVVQKHMRVTRTAERGLWLDFTVRSWDLGCHLNLLSSTSSLVPADSAKLQLGQGQLFSQ